MVLFFFYLHCWFDIQWSQISRYNLTVIPVFVWSSSGISFLLRAPLRVLQYYISINCNHDQDKVISEDEYFIKYLVVSSPYLIRIYLDFMSRQCPYLFGRSHRMLIQYVTSVYLLSQAWFSFTTVALFALILCYWAQYRLVQLGRIGHSLPALTNSNLNWI